MVDGPELPDGQEQQLPHRHYVCARESTDRVGADAECVDRKIEHASAPVMVQAQKRRCRSAERHLDPPRNNPHHDGDGSLV